MADEQETNKPDKTNARKGGPLTSEQRIKKQARFLSFYRNSGNIKFSCKYAGINRSTYYDWLKDDAEFSKQVADAEPEVDDTLEFAAYDRAVSGVPSYVVSQGKMVYEEIPLFDEDGKPKLDKWNKPEYARGKPLVERKYSDTLLITLLKARMPDKYKERVQNEHTGKDGKPLNVTIWIPDNGRDGYAEKGGGDA